MIFKCIICIYHSHYLIFSLCYCGRNVSPHCHMFTCIKGGGGLPSPHRKILGNHVQYFRSQCSDSNASIPYQCCRWLLPCCFPLTEPNSAVIALIMPQSQPTSIAFTLPMLLPLDPHYSWLWSKCCFFIYQPTHESKYYISTKVGHAIA